MTENLDQQLNSSSFGNLRRVDLRNPWPHEARSFTPWLAANLPILGNALGMDLELVSQESPVGPFSLDLLLKDVGSDRIVVVENQIEATNHDHLGKLLTYASGNEASAAVWIASEFREEHRQALDWLNGRTDQETEFFGIVLEALQIDDSRPAPNLRLVAFPNDFRKRAIDRRQGTVTPRFEAYQDFFQRLIDRLREQHRFTNARKGQAQSWYSFSAGTSGLTYAAAFGSGNVVRVELYIDRPDVTWNKAFFDGLLAQRSAIEAELGESLDWQRLDAKRASRVAISRPGAITDPPAALEDHMEWVIDRLLRSKQVFGPRFAIVASAADSVLEQVSAPFQER